MFLLCFCVLAPRGSQSNTSARELPYLGWTLELLPSLKCFASLDSLLLSRSPLGLNSAHFDRVRDRPSHLTLTHQEHVRITWSRCITLSRVTIPRRSLESVALNKSITAGANIWFARHHVHWPSPPKFTCISPSWLPNLRNTTRRMLHSQMRLPSSMGTLHIHPSLPSMPSFF